MYFLDIPPPGGQSVLVLWDQPILRSYTDHLLYSLSVLQYLNYIAAAASAKSFKLEFILMLCEVVPTTGPILTKKTKHMSETPFNENT